MSDHKRPVAIKIDDTDDVRAVHLTDRHGRLRYTLLSSDHLKLESTTAGFVAEIEQEDRHVD